MNRIPFILLALAAALTSCTKDFQEPGASGLPERHTLAAKLVGDTGGEHQSGTLLVKIADGSDPAVLSGDPDTYSISPALPFRPKNMEAARKCGLDKWYTISFDESMPLEEMAERIAAEPSVEAVQYNSLLNPVESSCIMPFTPLPETRTSPAEVPAMNDMYFRYQWNLVNTGDKSVASNAVEGADAGVRDAWRLTGGDPSVVVAVFDCAVKNDHEDLADNIWRNEAEIAGTDGVDDDGNGFIDDRYGFNFVKCRAITGDKVNEALEGEGFTGAVKGNSLDWESGSGHGTHVAGIIGAVNNNGIGVSSIAGGTGNNDGVRLMSCQIFQGSDTGTDVQNAMAFIYAADNGACIAQCSYGSSQIIKNDNDYIYGNETIGVKGSSFENAALQYFLLPENSNHSSLEGNIAVFAAGNHSNPYSSYPGALPYVISVTAFGADFLPGGYTNYGPGCKIAAPGGEYSDARNYGRMILSTGVTNVKTNSPGITEDSGRESEKYVYMQGTSMACPHVSGVIALGISYAGKLGKRFTREELTSLLLTSVNDIDQFLASGTKSYYDTYKGSFVDLPLSRYKGQMGTGAVDAWKFLMAIEGTPSIMVQAGKAMKMDVSRYVNPGTEYEVIVSQDTRTALGIEGDPVIRGGKLEITCTKTGSGKIRLTGAVGKDTGTEGGIGEMAYSRELSIVSRPFASNAGGWL